VPRSQTVELAAWVPAAGEIILILFEGAVGTLDREFWREEANYETSPSSISAPRSGHHAAVRIARAQAYPSRPARIIVPYPAGAFADISARLVGQWLSEHFGQQFVIENRPGAGGNIGTEVAARAPPDGYTLLLFNTGNASNATLYPKLNFVFIRDISPVAGIVRVPHVMEVNPS
jgi:hypothetical protein